MSLSPKSMFLIAVVLLAGVFGGTAAYRAVASASPEPAQREALVVDASDASAEKVRVRDGQRQKFAPCDEPAKLEGGRCVTDVVRTVTVPGAGSATPQPAPTSSGHHDDDDSGHHHSGEGEDGHHGGDDDDRDDDSDDDRDDDSGHHGGDDDHDDDDDHHGGDD